MPIDAASEDFFRLRLDHMIDLRHSLAVLSSRMPWQQIEASVAHIFSGKVRAGKKLSGIDLFGERIQMAAVKSNAGRPRVPLRTMIALLYLKHAFNESDEGVVQRWSETPVWQFFGGRAYFDQTLPCDSTTRIVQERLFSICQGVKYPQKCLIFHHRVSAAQTPSAIFNRIQVLWIDLDCHATWLGQAVNM